MVRGCYEPLLKVKKSNEVKYMSLVHNDRLLQIGQISAI